MGLEGNEPEWGSSARAERQGQNVTWDPDFSDGAVMVQTGLIFLCHFGLYLLIWVHAWSSIFEGSQGIY